VRVAYLVQSHDHPALLARLARTLRAGSDGTILVVHDASRERLEESALAGTGARVVQRTTPVLRGDFSMLDPYFEGAARLLADGDRFDWLVYLSGQDYPVRPVPAIEAGLAAAGVDGFLAHWDVGAAGSPWPPRRARRRYWYRYLRLPNALAPFLALLRPLEAVTPLHCYRTYGALVGWPARRPPFSTTFRCYGTWMWHSLRRPCVEFLLEQLAANRPLVEYYRRTVVPDESFVATVLVNRGLFRLANDNRRFADTAEQPGGHARALRADDFERLTDGRFDFARKAEPGTSDALLDTLDRRVHGRA
jgi:hypothetical protein